MQTSRPSFRASSLTTDLSTHSGIISSMECSLSSTHSDPSPSFFKYLVSPNLQLHDSKVRAMSVSALFSYRLQGCWRWRPQGAVVFCFLGWLINNIRIWGFFPPTGLSTLECTKQHTPWCLMVYKSKQQLGTSGSCL
jgi:hypothetical protein